jgi:hypothetical protein
MMAHRTLGTIQRATGEVSDSFGPARASSDLEDTKRNVALLPPAQAHSDSQTSVGRVEPPEVEDSRNGLCPVHDSDPLQIPVAPVRRRRHDYAVAAPENDIADWISDVSNVRRCLGCRDAHEH